MKKSLNPQVVKESYAAVEPQAESASAYFYGRLFAENPCLRALFPAAMDGQRDRLFHALTRIVWSLDSPDALSVYLARLGRDHRRYGVKPEHYDAFGRALLVTLGRYAGESWNAETEEAWSAAYAAVAEVMIAAAAKDDEADVPPWWLGEVLGHELRRPDLAVLTVRPGRPLPYRAGQYLMIQVAHWPRIWRPYSIANAPRADGLLHFHVRARPAGWVSGALVRQTKVGDTLLLGPTTGRMTLDPDDHRDVLCVAGGTGLAPLKALIEEAVCAARERSVHLLFGARTPADLYDLDDLRDLQERHPRLRVVPVVSADTSYHGMTGRVCDVLDRFPDWTGHEAYVAGPAGMVERTVSNLQEMGVPGTHVHHDPVEG